jgi:uncharacterized membrane protein YccC
MLHILLQLKPRDVPLRVALRNTAAVVLPLAAGILTGHIAPSLGIAAGALNTMFSDQPGPYRLRMQRLLLTAFAAGISAFVGGMIGASTPLVVLAALVWGILGGLLVALGPNAGRAGLTSMILLVITAAEPHTAAQALAEGSLIFAGGLLQMLLAIAAWPLQRYRPERHALAEVCRQLAASERKLVDSNEAPPVTQALIDIENLLHGQHRARGAAMESFRVLARIVERVRLESLALNDVEHAMPDGETKRTLTRLREYAARVLESTAAALDRGASPLAASAALEGFDAALSALRDINVADRRAQRLLAVAIARAEGLGGQLRAAVRNADFAGSRGELREQAAEARLPPALRPRNPIATLRANLNLSSVAFRHAIRCGVCLAIAVAGERIANVPHGFWVPMTTAIVLKPDFAGTLSFGVLRVIGTLLGLILTTGLVHYAFGGVWEQLALLALLSIGFRMFTTVHYGIGVMMLTGLVVILLSFHGIAPGETMLARGIATAIGSALALLAYAIWPTWEHLRVRPALANMIDSYRVYFDALLTGDARVRTDARAVSRSARTNAQASLERLRGEPRLDRSLIALAEAVFANANRFVRAAMALEAVLQPDCVIPERERLLHFGARVSANLDAIANHLRERGAAPAERLRNAERALAAALEGAGDNASRNTAVAIGDACDRITDSIDTLAHLLRTKREAA